MLPTHHVLFWPVQLLAEKAREQPAPAAAPVSALPAGPAPAAAPAPAPAPAPLQPHGEASQQTNAVPAPAAMLDPSTAWKLEKMEAQVPFPALPLSIFGVSDWVACIALRVLSSKDPCFCFFPLIAITHVYTLLGQTEASMWHPVRVMSPPSNMHCAAGIPIGARHASCAALAWLCTPADGACHACCSCCACFVVTGPPGHGFKIRQGLNPPALASHPTPTIPRWVTVNR